MAIGADSTVTVKKRNLMMFIAIKCVNNATRPVKKGIGIEAALPAGIELQIYAFFITHVRFDAIFKHFSLKNAL